MCADDEITKLEGEYAVLLEELRKKDDRVEVSDIRIGQVCRPSVIRTKLLTRNFAHKSFNYMLDRFAEHFSELQNIKSSFKTSDVIKEKLKRTQKKVSCIKRQKTMVMYKVKQMTPIIIEKQRIES